MAALSLIATEQWAVREVRFVPNNGPFEADAQRARGSGSSSLFCPLRHATHALWGNCVSILEQRVGDVVEGVCQLGADSGDRGDDHDRDQAGNEAIFDSRGTGVVIGNLEKMALMVMSFCPRLTVLSRSSGASMAGTRSRLPAEEYPRPKRASSWLITHSPTCSTLDAGRTVPLPSGHQGLPHTASIAARQRNAVMPITPSDASIGSQIRTLPTGTKTLAPVG